MFPTRNVQLVHGTNERVVDIEYPDLFPSTLPETFNVFQTEIPRRSLTAVSLKYLECAKREFQANGVDLKVQLMNTFDNAPQDTVYEVLSYWSRKPKNYSFCEIQNYYQFPVKSLNEITALSQLLQIDFLHRKYTNLSNTEKCIVRVACVLLRHPKVISFQYLNYSCSEIITGLNLISKFVPVVLFFSDYNHDVSFCSNYFSTLPVDVEKGLQPSKFKVFRTTKKKIFTRKLDKVKYCITQLFSLSALWALFSSFSYEWSMQFIHTASRKYRTAWRHPVNIILHALQYLLGGIIIGSVFFRIDFNQTNLNIRFNVLFFATISKTLFTIDQAIASVYNMRSIRKENKTHKVYASAYILADYVYNFPSMLINPTLYDVIFYPLADFKPSVSRWFYYYFTSLLSTQLNNAMSAFIGYIFDGLKIATLLEMATLFFLFIFSGTFKNSTNLRGWDRWLYTISFYRLSHNAFSTIYFKGVDLPCDYEDLKLNNCLYQNGDDLLLKKGINTSLTRNILFLLFYIVILRSAAVVLIKFHLFWDEFNINLHKLPFLCGIFTHNRRIKWFS
ncbi:ATP-binding cassette transporter, putative [Entamoeba invadens IP1]|uniref:ATP-binding cassette transporter, putative n=1 Tax=Entamoeba invadens IP1 TaxID=370355 RepID=UPI0002C3D044|nr:ATP-binding cassette transporter, putative [Entamoeba invadens IP1]ELP90428.1 ATP-binding cassette transporter, putative [Entamoeba invadens IP1]|eukprot:XP_004257199.1 ATP-binding cassette transporter, putative [Entamoeba invadens IP1]